MTEMDVISFGSVFLEIVFGHLERLPLPGEEIYVDPFAFSCGGAVTIAVAARRAGASAGLATLLGDDLGSRLVTEHALCEGVDLSPSHRVTGPVVGITVVLNFNRRQGFRQPHAPQTTRARFGGRTLAKRSSRGRARHGAICTPAPPWWTSCTRPGP